MSSLTGRTIPPEKQLPGLNVPNDQQARWGVLIHSGAIDLELDQASCWTLTVERQVRSSEVSTDQTCSSEDYQERSCLSARRTVDSPPIHEHGHGTGSSIGVKLPLFSIR